VEYKNNLIFYFIFKICSVDKVEFETLK